MTISEQVWLEEVNWNDSGLVAAIAQDASSNEILMMAWMNSAALEETLSSGWVTYWSRSRACLWRKGEQSGNRQSVSEIRLDCDGDVILMKVNQHGGIACHTGRRSCFYRVYTNGAWQTVEPIIKDPSEMYGEVDG